MPTAWPGAPSPWRCSSVSAFSACAQVITGHGARSHPGQAQRWKEGVRREGGVCWELGWRRWGTALGGGHTLRSKGCKEEVETGAVVLGRLWKHKGRREGIPPRLSRPARGQSLQLRCLPCETLCQEIYLVQHPPLSLHHWGPDGQLHRGKAGGGEKCLFNALLRQDRRLGRASALPGWGQGGAR